MKNASQVVKEAMIVQMDTSVNMGFANQSANQMMSVMDPMNPLKKFV